MIGVHQPKKFGEKWSLQENRRLNSMLDTVQEERIKVLEQIASKHENLKDKVHMLLARIEENYGHDYWTAEPRTNLQEAAQEVAKLIIPRD